MPKCQKLIKSETFLHNNYLFFSAKVKSQIVINPHKIKRKTHFLVKLWKFSRNFSNQINFMH